MPFFKPKRHIVVFRRGAIEKILSGRKKIESRFSKVKMVPYMQVKRGDILILKESGKKAKGTVEVSNVLFFAEMTPKKINKIKIKYNSKILADREYWEIKKEAKFGTLIFLRNPKRYLAPIRIEKKDRCGWRVIKEN